MYGDYKPNEQSVHRKFLGNSRTYIRDIIQCSILSNVLGIWLFYLAVLLACLTYIQSMLAMYINLRRCWN